MDNVTIVTADTKILGVENEVHWYVVEDQFSINARIEVKGDVHLILADGCNLDVNGGINVAGKQSLTIYGQTNNAGALSAEVGNDGSGHAGIGGVMGGTCGSITINGGTVKATGGDYGPHIEGGAGIGGGVRAIEGGTITINGGVVTAKGGSDAVAGIGRGYSGSDTAFNTRTNGRAFIMASFISDHSNEGKWSGIIFEDKRGQVYGKQTLPAGITIPEKRTLTVPTGTTLTIPEKGVTLDGTINVQGELVVNGLITGTGQITPDEKRPERLDESYKPDAPTVSSATSTSMTLDKLSDDVEYSMDGTDWKEEPTFDKLAPETEYTFYTRYKGRIYQPSEPSEAQLYTAFDAPDDPEAHVTIDYAGETVTAHNGYEVSTRDDEDEWGEWSKETSVYPDGWLRVRKAASGNVPAGDESESARVPDRPDAPEGFTVTDVSVEGASDGTIKGVDTSMEYRREEENTWTTCPQGTLTGLASGEYYVRYKATSEQFASKHANINVMVVSPTTTFSMADGNIRIYEDNGRIMVWQDGGKGYKPIIGNDIRIIGGECPSTSYVAIDGVTTDLNVTLANVQMVGSGEIVVSSADNANVTFYLEGENQLRESGLMIYGGNVIIDGSGSLTIGTQERPCKRGIYTRSLNSGNLTVNGGTIDIHADEADIILTAEETTLTVNGGILRSHKANDVAVSVGGAVAINGGTVELANAVTGGKAVTITGGSVTSGEITPALTDGTVPVYQIVVTGLGTGSVDALMLKQGDDVHNYGLPETTTDGTLSLYLPIGTYEGTAIISGKLFTFTATSRESGETSSKATDTGISFDCPEDSRPTLNEDGTVTLPGGSTIHTADGEPINVPQDGGVFNPEDGSLVLDTYMVRMQASTGGTVSGGGAFEKDATVTVTATPNSGYKFVRWEENGKEVSTEASYSFKVTTNRTLTAIFANIGGGGSVMPSYHTLTFNTNGGSAIDKLRVQSGKTIDLSEYVPTREGYTFDGWYRDEALTEKIATVKLSRNTTIYAGWTQQEPALSVSDIFIDVAPDAWYVDAVQFAYDEGIMTGTSATTFSPALTTTRGMIVAILHRLEGNPATSGDRFTDVATGDWYADAVNWAASEGIVNGMSATTFAPNAWVTREQLAAILYNYAEWKGMDMSARADLSEYVDANSISEWARDVMQWAVGEGLISGITNDTLVPQGNATRAQVAAIFQRFLTK